MTLTQFLHIRKQNMFSLTQNFYFHPNIVRKKIIILPWIKYKIMFVSDREVNLNIFSQNVENMSYTVLVLHGSNGLCCTYTYNFRLRKRQGYTHNIWLYIQEMKIYLHSLCKHISPYMVEIVRLGMCWHYSFYRTCYS